MKILLATWENEMGTQVLPEVKYPYILSSFVYLRKKPIDVIMKIFKIKKFFMLDSGAHTFQKPGKDTDYDKFVYEYVTFIKKFQKYIDEYVELDIENKVGLKQVEKWREYMTKELGKPPVVVWHRERGKDYWLYSVKKYPYVGFSGFVVLPNGEPEVPEKYVGWFVKTAHDNQSKIHGFGLTKQRLLKKYHFDTVDSSTWLRRVSNGELWIFKDGKLQYVRNVKKKDGVKIDLKTHAKWNITELYKFNNFLEEYWKIKEEK